MTTKNWRLALAALTLLILWIGCFILGMLLGAALTPHRTDAAELPKAQAVQEAAKEQEEPASADRPASLGIYEVTAYCPCEKCCGKSDGITASGTVATAGRTIAADTNDLPFGSEVIINGRTYVVEDRGGAIRGKRIDIFFDTHAAALEFGRQSIEVFYGGLSNAA